MAKLTRNKKFLVGLLAVVLTVVFVFVLDAPNAKAGFIDYVLNGLAIIVYNLLLFFGKLITLAAYLLKSAFEIESTSTFTKAPIVVAGWQITRGLCNMIFALLLLLMAFDAILQTNKFPAKTLLPKLVIVALLINFSLVFAGIIIDFSQILTQFFIDRAGGPDKDIGVQLANGLAFSSVFQTTGKEAGNEAELRKNFGDSSPSLMNVITTLIFGVIIILIAAFAIGAGAILMVIRLVSLWMLLIFAPLAWVFAIAPLPGLSNVVSGWWEKFFKWTFFAPIYAFFIYLAVMASNTAKVFTQTSLGKANDNQAVGEIFANGFLAGDGIAVILQYLVIVIILLTGLKTAQDSGLQGAQGVIGFGKTLRRGAWGVTKFAGSYLERKIARGAEAEGTGVGARLRRGFSYLAPAPWKKAWEERQKQKEREAYPVAIGARQDIFNKIISREKTDYQEQADRFRAQEERKNIATKNAEELILGFESAKEKGNTSKMRAYLLALAEQGDENELMKYYNKTQGKKYDMSAQGWSNFVKDNLAPQMGEQAAYRTGHDLIRAMEINGRWIGRPFDFNVKTRQYEIRDAKVAEATAHGEWTKEDPQKQAINFGRHSLIAESYDKDGNTIDKGLSEYGIKKLGKIQSNQAGRMKAQTKDVALFNHAHELKKINLGLYKELLKEVNLATSGLEDKEIDSFLEEKKKEMPKAAEEEVAKSLRLLKEDLDELRKEEAQPKKPKERAGFV